MSLASGNDRVLVVGAGIVGLGCAHFLSRAGWQVTIIDRGPIAGACSHANCGFICPSHVLPLTEPGAIRVAIKSLFNPQAPFRVKPRLSPPMWSWLWQFARRCNRRQMLSAGTHLKAILDSSLCEYRRLVAEEQLECEWQEKGLLYVLRTDRGMREFAETDRMLNKHFGVSAERIDAEDLTSFEPALMPGLAGAYHYQGDVSVRPDMLNSHWSRRLRECGVTFIEHCELQKICKSAGKISSLQTSLGEKTADRFVFATGAWSADLSAELECQIPIQPGKGYSVTMPRPEPCPNYPMLFPEHKVGVSPFENGYRLGSMMEFAGYDTSIPKRRIQQLRDAASQYLVRPFTDGPQQTWYGWRPMTWDSLPIIGRVPRLANAYLATGHNMLGLTLAAATGKLIAEIIQDIPPHIDPTAYSPTRFET